MRPGFRGRLLLGTLATVALAVLTADGTLSAALDAELSRQVRADLTVRARLVARAAQEVELGTDDLAGWDRFADQLGQEAEGRVTVVRADGVVLGDSGQSLAEVRALERHEHRPEVAAALRGEAGADTRTSATLGRRMVYVALPLVRAGHPVAAIRMARPLDEVDAALGKVHTFVQASAVLALVLAALFVLATSRGVSRRIARLTEAARKMAGGDLEARSGLSSADELGQLGRALDQLASGLQSALGSLRWERDLMGRVLEGMREGVLLVDARGSVVLANAALREMFLLGQDVSGRPVGPLLGEAGLEALLGEAASRADTVSRELETGGIKPRRLLVSATALHDAPRDVLAVCVDVTELRRLENLRRDFVANASHELRTPVAAVRAAAETLRRALEVQPAAAADFVEMIERNAERLHRLVDDLLDLSRLESRDFSLQLETVDVAEVVEGALCGFSGRAQAKRVALAWAAPAGGCWARADRRALEQVVVNLLDNAIKYCPPDASVTVSAEQQPGTLRLVVEDTGPGIEPRHLPRLFERFYRVDDGRSRDVGGTGLGLSIVKHLVEAMRGTVTVESTVGRGTRFAVGLPTAG